MKEGWHKSYTSGQCLLGYGTIICKWYLHDSIATTCCIFQSICWYTKLIFWLLSNRKCYIFHVFLYLNFKQTLQLCCRNLRRPYKAANFLMNVLCVYNCLQQSVNWVAAAAATPVPMCQASTSSCTCAKSRQLARLQVLQNHGSWMFMLRVKTLSARDCH